MISPSPPSSAMTPSGIGESDIRDAFERIISAIHLDGDDRKGKIHASPTRLAPSLGHHVPDLQGTPPTLLSSPMAARSSGAPVTPLSSPSMRTGSTAASSAEGHLHSSLWLGAGYSPDSVGIALAPSLSGTPSRRGGRPVEAEEAGMKSFLDDDWLRERVRVDSNMALVAGGLVRSTSTTPPLEVPTLEADPFLLHLRYQPHQQHPQHRHRSRQQRRLEDHHPGGEMRPCPALPDEQPSEGEAEAHHHHHPFLYGLASRAFPSSAFGSNRPPRDYICKLCSVPGHWLKDCHLFEPKEATAHGGRPGHLRSASLSNLPQGSSARQAQVPPPGNYVCRLCGVPGHWIEQCSKFQPRNQPGCSGASGGGGGGRSGETFKGSVPPKSYICNLCHQPGHWIQQCSEFTPLYPQRKRSNSSERGSGRFF